MATKPTQEVQNDIFHLPKIFQNYWRTKRTAEKKITEATVLFLFREDKVSVSKGAQLLDMPIQDFMNLLYKNGISLDDETPKELEEGVKTLRELRERHNKKAIV